MWFANDNSSVVFWKRWQCPAICDIKSGHIQQLGLNPVTADQRIDDAQVSPCRHFIAGHTGLHVVLWDAATGTLITTMDDPRDKDKYDQFILFTPDNLRLVSLETNSSIVRIWDIQAITSHAGSVTTVWERNTLPVTTQHLDTAFPGYPTVLPF
jgi:WD40 repeat protein